MKQEEAIQIIMQALDQACKKGAYSLQDTAFISQALSVLFPTPVQPSDEQKDI
jgi:20S proteasome alpha/beta subunit